MSPRRSVLLTLLVLSALLAAILGKFFCDRQSLQARYDAWQQGAPRPSAPPAVSGIATPGTTEEGVHDR